MNNKLNRRTILKATSIASVSGMIGTASANEHSKNNRESTNTPNLRITNHSTKKKKIKIDIHRGKNSAGKSAFSTEIQLESGVNVESAAVGKAVINEIPLKGGQYWVTAETDSGWKTTNSINLSKEGHRENEQLLVRITERRFVVGMGMK